MSVNAQCSEAIDRLMEAGRVFTEIDVVNEAAKAHHWSPALFRRGLRAANVIVGTRFRDRKLARYGPVQVPGHGIDFARIATKIAYASAENGPVHFEGPDGEPCPNGRFPRMLLEDVPAELNHRGRRAGAKRNDLQPWDAQDIAVVHVTDAAILEAPEPAPVVALPEPKKLTLADLRRKNAELTANLNAAHERIQELENELDRVRSHRAKGDVPDVLDLLAELEGRIVGVEKRLPPRGNNPKAVPA